MTAGRREQLASALETWRPVVGWEGRYEVSDRGRVRSTLRGVITPQINGGYLNVGLFRGTRRTWARVHRLMAQAFLEPRPGEDIVRHLDGNPLNNRLDNLAWGTTSDNLRDQVRHGTHSRTRRTHCPSGHEYTPENTYPHARYRACLICVKAQWRRAEHKRRERRLRLQDSPSPSARTPTPPDHSQDN